MYKLQLQSRRVPSHSSDPLVLLELRMALANLALAARHWAHPRAVTARTALTLIAQPMATARPVGLHDLVWAARHKNILLATYATRR